MAHEKSVTTRDVDLQIQQLSILQLSNCCPNHTKNNVTKFCSQHDTVLCNECYSRAHKKCKSVVSIEKASQGVKNCAAYEDLKTRMSGLVRHFEKVLDSSKQIEINLKMDLETIAWDLHKKREQLTKQLDFIEKSMKEELKEKYEICRNSNNEYVTEVQSKQRDVKCWIKCLSSETDFSDLELFKIIKVLDSKAFQLESSVSEHYKFLTIKHHLDDNISTFKEQLNSFGKVSVIECQNFIQRLPKLQQGVRPIQKTDIKPILRQSFRISPIKSDTKIDRVCVLPDEKLLLSAENKPLLFVSTSDGTDSKIIKLKYRPYDVDLLDDRRAIVTVGGDGYQILDLATLTLSQRIKPSGSACRSVSCCAGRIIVHGDGNHVLHTDVQGMLKKRYEAEHNPDFIYQADDGSVYYDSWGDNSLYKLPRDGEGGAKPFFTHPDLRWPRGIAGDGQGSVFVAGESSDNIHKISFNGKIHSIILGEVDGIRRPYDLSYNRDTKQLLIVNNDCTSIDIYDMFV